MPRQRTNERILIPSREKRRILEECGNVCAHCGKELVFETATGEHVIPLSKGGTNDPENLVILCEACNKAKSDDVIPPVDYYKHLPKPRRKKLQNLFDDYVKRDDWLDMDNLFVMDWFNISIQRPVILPGSGKLYFVPVDMTVKKVRPDTAFEHLLLYTGRLSYEDKSLMVTSPDEIDLPYYLVERNGQPVALFSTYLVEGKGDISTSDKNEDWDYILNIDWFVNPEMKFSKNSAGPVLFNVIQAILNEIQKTLLNGSRGNMILTRVRCPASAPFTDDLCGFFSFIHRNGVDIYDIEKTSKTALPENRIRNIEFILFAGSNKELRTLMQENHASSFQDLENSIAKKDMQAELTERLKLSKKVQKLARTEKEEISEAKTPTYCYSQGGKRRKRHDNKKHRPRRK